MLKFVSGHLLLAQLVWSQSHSCSQQIAQDIRLVFINARSLLGQTKGQRSIDRRRNLQTLHEGPSPPAIRQHFARESLNLHIEGRTCWLLATRRSKPSCSRSVATHILRRRLRGRPQAPRSFFPSAQDVTEPFQPGTTVKARRLCAPKGITQLGKRDRGQSSRCPQAPWTKVVINKFLQRFFPLVQHCSVMFGISPTVLFASGHR